MQRGCLHGLVEEVELEEAAEEVSVVVEPIAADCRGWQ